MALFEYEVYPLKKRRNGEEFGMVAFGRAPSVDGNE